MKRSGFSLIEIIVVTGIITLAFMGILSLVKRAIVVYYSNQKYLEAAVMAQEGLELTRYVRDQNWLTDLPFYQNLAQTSADGSVTILALDAQSVDIRPEARQKIIQFYNSRDGGKDLSGSCGGDFSGFGDSLVDYVKSPCAAIWLDSKNHEDRVSRASVGDTAALQPTIFSRVIKVTYFTNQTSDPSDDYIYVNSLVAWQDRGAAKYFTLGEYFYDYNWKF